MVRHVWLRHVYNNARFTVQQGDNLEEEDNLMKAFVGNGYVCSFICSASASRPSKDKEGEREEESPPTVHLPYYIAGVIERIRSGVQVWTHLLFSPHQGTLNDPFPKK